MELARAVHDRDIEILEERIARLSSNLAVIRVGAPTVSRAEGALPAHRGRAGGDPGRGVRGHRAGGGTALLRSAPALDALVLSGDYARGAEIVRSVLSEPLYWIASNAGYDGRRR